MGYCTISRETLRKIELSCVAHLVDFILTKIQFFGRFLMSKVCMFVKEAEYLIIYWSKEWHTRGTIPKKNDVDIMYVDIL